MEEAKGLYRKADKKVKQSGKQTKETTTMLLILKHNI